MDFGPIKVTPSRKCFTKPDIANITMRSFDYVHQTKYTTSFITFVINSYEIKDTLIIKNVMPENLSDLYKKDEIINEIVLLFESRGIKFDKNPIPTDHFSAIQKLVFRSSGDPESIYTPETFSDECDGAELNFLSEHIHKYLTVISHHLDRPLVILYYTPLGFMRFNLAEIDFSEAEFLICLSGDLCILPEFSQFCITSPYELYGERRAGFSFFPIIKFQLISGIFQPIFDDSSIAHFTTNCTSFPTRLDSLAFPYDSISGRTVILIGLIGTYSDIKKHLSHPDVKVDVIEYFDNIHPFIGIYTSKTSFIYMFLYIPHDFPPNHPLFIEVTNYSVAFMHRVCCKTLFLTDEEKHFNVTSEFTLGGLHKFYGNRILGTFNTSLILHNDLTNCVGKVGKDSILFDSCDEFLLWKFYISRRYKPTAVSSSSSINNEKNRFMPFNQAVQLISTEKTNLIEKILHGERSKFKDNEDIKMNSNYENITCLEDIIRDRYFENILLHDETSEALFLSSIEKKMDEMTSIFNLASLWMKANSFVCKNKCKFCQIEVENKPDQDDDDWSVACYRCKLMKTQWFNTTTKGQKRPTSFLEDRVDELQQNEEDCSFYLKAFSRYLIGNEFSANTNFAKWFFEFWTIRAFINGLKDIQSTDFFDIIDENKIFFNPDDDNFSLVHFILQLTGLQLEGIDFYTSLPSLFSQIPIEMDSDEIRAIYRNYYIQKIVPVLCQPIEMSPYLFAERCKKEIDILIHAGFVEDSVVEIKGISSTNDNKIEVEIYWNDKNKRDNRSVDYTFYSINDISLLNSNFASKPLYCEPYLFLYSQPRTLFIVNAFRIVKYSTTLIVSVLGTTLWLNIVKDGYRSSFLPPPLFSLDVDKDSGNETFCSFSENANLIVILAKIKGELIFHSINIMKDFLSAKIIVKRPFSHIAPLSSSKNSKFSPKLFNFVLSNDAKLGIFCSNYCYDDQIENCEYALIKFDPWTLVANDREDSFDSPFSPLYIDSLTSRLICQCEGESALTPKNSSSYTAKSDFTRIDSILGVICWKGEPRVLKFVEGREPIILIPDKFKIEAPFEYSPTDAVNIVTDSIDQFGLSEIDRISNGHYPIDAVTVESVFDLNSDKDKFEKYFETGKQSAHNGIELFLFAHQSPIIHANRIQYQNNCSIMNVDTKFDSKDPKRSFFSFFHRVTGAPRFLVKSQNVPTVIYSQEFMGSVLEAGFIKRKTTFPPLPLTRELINRGNAMSHTFSVVNGGGNFDSNLISSYSGIQFVNGPSGSIRIATEIVPTVFNKFSKIEEFYLLNLLSFTPVTSSANTMNDSLSATHCALSLIHAIVCSNVVVLATRRDIEFVVTVFEKMNESMPIIEENMIDKIEINVENLQLFIICDINSNHLERDAERLRNEIGILINGSTRGERDLFFEIMNREVNLLPAELSPIEHAQIISEKMEVHLNELEKETTKIFNAAAIYGSFIDNSYLFDFD
ncbi:hypothetical protein TRFO_18672 [Tritrichomonas foetus]|uniref:Uncharacterized protein n=1 Tax=Tritrichomonas foetus TaxID=1144522 RepID=A0A1J4KKE7_9EUKA|nr:hypothetical protein TRFO_18672 [Tritrichomonas foetus]|eukprot:OHT11777.1 hypothetical protein TRFO_18672 [Tritrichomonas foetus]